MSELCGSLTAFPEPLLFTIFPTQMQITAYSCIFTISSIAFGCWMVWLILELVPGVQTLSQVSGVALASLMQHGGVRCLLLCVLRAMHCPESWSPGAPEHLTPVIHLHLLHWKLLQIISPRFAGNHWSFTVFSSCLPVLPPPLVLYFSDVPESCEPHLFLLFCE